MKKKHSHTVPNTSSSNKPSWTNKLAWLLIIIIGGAFWIHSHGLELKHPLTFDEIVHIRLALQLKSDIRNYNTIQIYNERLNEGNPLPYEYFKQPLFKHPPLFCGLVYLTYSTLEKGTQSWNQLLHTAGFIPNIMGCLIIVLVFLIGKKLFDMRVGLTAAFLLAIDANHWICSQKIWMETTLAFFFWLTLYLFFLRYKHKYLYLLTGVTAGLALLTKYPAVLIFPIILTYIVFHEPKTFRVPHFYLFPIIAFLLFLPWIILNFHFYGRGFLKRIMEDHLVQDSHLIPYIIGSSTVLIAFGAFFYFHSISKSFIRFRVSEKTLRNSYLGLIVILYVCLLFQQDFLSAIIKSLTWNYPIMNDFGAHFEQMRQTAWYFYFERIISYSPFYFFFYYALFKAYRGNKFDLFLAYTCLWVLGFYILWGNGQGRYLLCFMPAALLMVSRSIYQIFDGIKSKFGIKEGRAYSVLYILMLLYFLIRTFQVNIPLAWLDNYAYYY